MIPLSLLSIASAFLRGLPVLPALVRVTKTPLRSNLVSDSLFLRGGGCEQFASARRNLKRPAGAINTSLTSSFSSGKPPSILRSHSMCVSTGAPICGRERSQTRKRPPVSSSTSGISMMLRMLAPPDAFVVGGVGAPSLLPLLGFGGGKVRKSSVCTHVARCCHRHRSQYCVSAVCQRAGRMAL